MTILNHLNIAAVFFNLPRINHNHWDFSDVFGFYEYVGTVPNEDASETEN